MNTNSNVYTVVYTTVVCVLVAAILAFAAMSLRDRQEANQKAEIISQILTAAQAEQTTIDAYKASIASAYLVNLAGEVVDSLNLSDAQVCTTSDLKAQNRNITDGSAETRLPVYAFANGTQVIPVYGAGLWGPVWGYIAFAADGTIAGACFDHASETPGLGGKIKDDPSFSAQFCGKKVDFNDAKAFNIVKGGAPEGKENAIDAISGATMTSKGLDAAINVWLEAYKAYLSTSKED